MPEAPLQHQHHGGLRAEGLRKQKRCAQQAWVGMEEVNMLCGFGRWQQLRDAPSPHAHPRPVT